MPSNHETPRDLSDGQRVLLQRAVRNGYFKDPREISTLELAEATDMTSREAIQELNLALDIVLKDTDFDE